MFNIIYNQQDISHEEKLYFLLLATFPEVVLCNGIHYFNNKNILIGKVKYQSKIILKNFKKIVDHLGNLVKLENKVGYKSSTDTQSLNNFFNNSGLFKV